MLPSLPAHLGQRTEVLTLRPLGVVPTMGLTIPYLTFGKFYRIGGCFWDEVTRGVCAAAPCGGAKGED